jgi:hypothetical protein
MTEQQLLAAIAENIVEAIDTADHDDHAQEVLAAYEHLLSDPARVQALVAELGGDDAEALSHDVSGEKRDEGGKWTSGGGAGGKEPPDDVGSAEDAGAMTGNEVMRESEHQPPGRLELINETDSVVVGKLAQSMKENGWMGPPLIEVAGYAMTGSHRATAAHRAGLKNIPVIAVDQDEFVQAARAAGYIGKGEGWDDLRLSSDDERMEVMKKLPGSKRNRAAMTVMEMEVERNYSRPGSDSRLEPQHLAHPATESLKEKVRRLAAKRYPHIEELSHEAAEAASPIGVRREVEYDEQGRVKAFTDVILVEEGDE